MAAMSIEGQVADFSQKEHLALLIWQFLNRRDDAAGDLRRGGALLNI